MRGEGGGGEEEEGEDSKEGDAIESKISWRG